MTSVHDTAHYDLQRNPQKAADVVLVMPEAIRDSLRVHGEATYPHECCGILLGTANEAAITVQHALPVGNTRLDSAHNRYNIEPIDLIRAQREGRARGLDIVGFYHSHPDHPAFPSSTDLAEAHWYGCAYVITSVDGTGATPRAEATNSFFLSGTGEDNKVFLPQTISVESR